MPPTVNHQLSTVNSPAALPYNPAASLWLSVDPLSDKYPGASPYVYCADNPVRLVDVDGRKVKPFGEVARMAIINTLRKEDRSYVKFNKHGFVRRLPLIFHKSESQNYASLKELVLSKRVVEVHTSDCFSYQDKGGTIGTKEMSCYPYNSTFGNKDIACEYVSGLSTGERGWYAETLFPDSEGEYNSTNTNTQIYIHSSLSETGMAEAFSHEGYGHALLYERNGGNHDGASHQSEGLIETNIVLKQMIISARKETLQNIEEPWGE